MAEEPQVDELLLIQIDSLDQKLDRVYSIVRADRIEERFRHISGKFTIAIMPVKTQLEDLKKRVRKGLAEGDTSDHHWRRYQELKEDTQRILDECLDYLGGIAVRAMKLEDEMCDLAEHMVKRYFADRAGYTWASVMIVGEERLFDRIADITQIVRLRFPEWDIWSLPLSAHEFGQLVARHETVAGLRAFYKEECDKCRKEREAGMGEAGVAVESERLADLEHLEGVDLRHLQTLFADIFATYFLGPAYLYSRLYLRLNPMTAFQRTERKPSFACRLGVMLETLNQMNEASKPSEQDPGVYKGDLNRTQKTFDTAIQSIDPDYGGGPVLQSPHDKWFTGMYTLLRSTFGNEGFTTSNQNSSREIAKKLADRSDPNKISLTELSHAVILNAAWQARVSPGQASPVDIELSATALCRRIQTQEPRIEQPGPQRPRPA